MIRHALAAIAAVVAATSLAGPAESAVSDLRQAIADGKASWASAIDTRRWIRRISARTPKPPRRVRG